MLRMAQSAQRAEPKKHVLTLIALVLVLHGIMIGAYYAFGVRDRPIKTQQTFALVWIVLTLIIVTVMLKRVRRTRRRR